VRSAVHFNIQLAGKTLGTMLGEDPVKKAAAIKEAFETQEAAIVAEQAAEQAAVPAAS
jgi:hypothetical protein